MSVPALFSRGSAGEGAGRRVREGCAHPGWKGSGESGRRTGPGVTAGPGAGQPCPVLALASKGVQAQRGWSQLKGIAGPEGSFFTCEYSPKISRCEGREGNLLRAVWVTRAKKGEAGMVSQLEFSSERVKKGGMFFFSFSRNASIGNELGKLCEWQ